MILKFKQIKSKDALSAHQRECCKSTAGADQWTYACMH